MLKQFLWSFAFACVALLSVSAQTPAPAPAAPAGRVEGQIIATRVRGPVSAENKRTGDKIGALKNNDRLTQYYSVHTGKGGSVVLVMSNGATVQLAEESDLDIEQFEQDPLADNVNMSNLTEEPGNTTSKTRLKLARGELVGKVVHLHTDRGTEFEVATPVGAAGIRGTTFRIVFRPTGNGQAYQFQLSTSEGRVVLSGGVAPPAGLAVTDNKEISITLSEEQVKQVQAALASTTTTPAATPATTPDPNAGTTTNNNPTAPDPNAGTTGTTPSSTTTPSTASTTTPTTPTTPTVSLPTVTIDTISSGSRDATINAVQGIAAANAATIFVPVNTPVTTSSSTTTTTDKKDTTTTDTSTDKKDTTTTDTSKSTDSTKTSTDTSTTTTPPAPSGTTTTPPAGTGTGTRTTPGDGG